MNYDGPHRGRQRPLAIIERWLLIGITFTGITWSLVLIARLVLGI